MFRSYSVGTSPINIVTGPSQPRQKSIAMSITPSMPEAPQFADNGHGGPWSLFRANTPTSRMGFELEEKGAAEGMQQLRQGARRQTSANDSIDNVLPSETALVRQPRELEPWLRRLHESSASEDTTGTSRRSRRLIFLNTPTTNSRKAVRPHESRSTRCCIKRRSGVPSSQQRISTSRDLLTLTTMNLGWYLSSKSLLVKTIT